MNKLQIFKNNDFGQVRTMLIDGEPWFVGKDVANVLGYQNGSRDIDRHVDEEDRLMHQISTLDQNRNMLLINESGLYSLILSSKLPTSKMFKRWVTSEVLPCIRKAGSYVVGQDAFKPSVRTFQTEFLYTVSEVAKIIKTNPAYVYELIKAGHLQVLKLGSFKIRRSTFENFLQKFEGYDLTNPYSIRKIESRTY